MFVPKTFPERMQRITSVHAAGGEIISLVLQGMLVLFFVVFFRFGVFLVHADEVVEPFETK